MNNITFINKTLLSTAMGVVMGLPAASTATADTVISLDLKDFNADGLQSDFAFNQPPPGNGPLKIGGGLTRETGCVNATDNNNCDPIFMGDFNSVGTDVQSQPRFEVGVFTTGFNFGGQGPFNPNIGAPDGNASINATIDPVLAASGDGHALQFGALELGGVYHAGGTVPGFTQPGQQFYLSPDNLTNCTGAAPSYIGVGCGAAAITDSTGPAFSTPFGYNVDITDLGSGEYGVVVKYVGTIGLNPANPDPSGGFTSNEANWRLEGVMKISDEAPIVTVDGADPFNVDPNITYVDPGASCFDGVDGTITSTGPGVPSFVVTNDNPSDPNTGSDGNNFTVTYTCTDSQNQITVATRDVEVGNDIEPPVITLLEPDTPTQGRSDSDMGATVDILVDVPYVDASATCLDNTGDIPFGTTGPGTLLFTVDDDTVDTSSVTTQDITFTCNDAADNGPVQAVRTVNVKADDIAPVITLPAGTETVIVTNGNEYDDPGAACLDTNPVDPGAEIIPLGTVGQPGFTVTPDPATIDTSVDGDTTLVFQCVDAVGNQATDVERIVRVVSGQSFNILSMTISDVDGDRIAGCFRFNSLNTETCELAHRYSSDDSVDTGFNEEANKTLPGTGTDLDDDGNPIGVRFGSFQEIDEISPGFNFSGFPFVPFTFDPPSAVAVPPAGIVTVVDEGGGVALIDITSLPWGGLYNSNTPNEFYMPPDPGTLNATITQINNDNDGDTRTFNYFMSWSHVITAEEDPTGAFVNFNSFWRLEGVMTVDSTPVIINNAPIITRLTARQGGNDPTVDIPVTDGLVTLTVVAEDPDGDDINYDWSESDSRLVPFDGMSTNPEFVFDPSGLTEDIYQVVIKVSDDVDEPKESKAQLLLRISALAPALGPEDSDGDGIPDNVEGFGDSDNDHLPNYQDPIIGQVNPGVNRSDFSDPPVGDVVVDTGRLVIGDTAFAVGDSKFTVTETDISKYGGPGATPVDNAFDRVNRVDGIGHSGGGIYDFKVTELPIGATVRAVLPQAKPIPVQSIYKLYRSANGWVNFQPVSGNALASATRVGGVCPGPDDPAYDDAIGLVEGDDCVRLTIVDGGVNDADTLRNGIIVDPGTVSGNGPANKGSQDNGIGCSISTSPAQDRTNGDWFLLTAFLAWLGWKRRKVEM